MQKPAMLQIQRLIMMLEPQIEVELAQELNYLGVRSESICIVALSYLVSCMSLRQSKFCEAPLSKQWS